MGIRRIVSPSKPLRSAEFSARTPVSGRLTRLSRLSMEIASSPEISLLIEMNSLFQATGNSSHKVAEKLVNPGPDWAGGVWCRGISLYFAY